MSARAWIETHGIDAKWSGPCRLCGDHIEFGDRIYKLPAKRGAAWVCRDCRWRSDATPTIEDVVRKLRHRLALRRPIGLNKTEAALLADALNAYGAINNTTQDEDELRNWLTTSVADGLPANLAMDDARTALQIIDSDAPP